jgi:hypothetical protein
MQIMLFTYMYLGEQDINRHSVSTPEKTQCMSIIKTNKYILFRRLTLLTMKIRNMYIYCLEEFRDYFNAKAYGLLQGVN